MPTYDVGLLRSHILKAMQYTTSADSAYKLLRDWGYTYTRKDVRENWKIVGESDKWATVLNTYGIDKPLPKHYTFSLNRDLKRKYLYHFAVKVYDLESKEERIKRVAIYTDKLASISSVWESGRIKTESYQRAKGYEILSWRIVGVER